MPVESAGQEGSSGFALVPRLESRQFHFGRTGQTNLLERGHGVCLAVLLRGNFSRVLKSDLRAGSGTAPSLF